MVTQEVMQAHQRGDETPAYDNPFADGVYLGSFTGEDGRLADLYLCTNPIDLMALYSSEPVDYDAGLEFVGTVPGITEAYERARERGILRDPADILDLHCTWSASFDAYPGDSATEEELQDWSKKVGEADAAFHAALDRLRQSRVGGTAEE